MLAEVYKLVEILEKLIGDSCRVYLGVRGSTLVFQIEWMIEDNIVKLEHAISYLDLLRGETNDTLQLEYIVRKAKSEYERIKELQRHAPKTKERKD